jgi:UDP-glucose 4-epimerase
MRLLVTGGSGFIGSNLCRAALADPAVDQVLALDDLSTGSTANLDGVDVRLVVGSILDDATLDRAMAGADAVVHLAAVPSVPRSIVDPVTAHTANATGTVRVLEAVRRNDVGYLVLASSSSVYGANPVLPKREDGLTRPLSPYAASKLAAEAYCLAYRACYRIPTLALRLFNVYGPYQPADHPYAAAIPRFLCAVLRGEPIEVYGDGQQSRDFTYVGTVCQLLLDAVRRRVDVDSPVNLAFGVRTTLLDVIALISETLGCEVPVRHLPGRVGDVRHSQADGRLRAQLFPQVRATALPTGLRLTAEWLAGQALATMAG